MQIKRRLNHSKAEAFPASREERILFSELLLHLAGAALFLILFLAVLFSGRPLLGAQGDPRDGYTLKGAILQADGGKIERKVRVPSFETVEAPVGRAATALDRGVLGRNLWEGTGGAGTLKQIYMRETTTHIQNDPILFLQNTEDTKTTRAIITEKGRFQFDSVPTGEYLLTIEVPGHSPQVLELEIGPSSNGNEKVIELTHSFRPSDPEETRLLKNHYNPPIISEKVRSEYDKGIKAQEEARLEEALDRFKLAAERDNSFTEAFERMGLIYLSQDRIEEAEQAFRSAYAVDPYSYRSVSNLGTILLNSGEAEEALNFNIEAVKLRPQDPQARYHLAMSLFQAGNLEDALDQLARVKALKSDHYTQPQLLSAEIYRMMGDFDSMIHELEDFLKFYPRDGKIGQVSQALQNARELKEES